MQALLGGRAAGAAAPTAFASYPQPSCSHPAAAPSRRHLHSSRQRRLAAAGAAAAAAAVGPTLQALQGWLSSSQGVKVGNVEAAVDLNGRPILVAAQDANAGDALLTVGEKAWISPAAAARSAIGPAVAGLEPWLQVALLLVHERFVLGGKGAWGPYVGSLPAAPPSPLFWTQEQLGMLQGTQVLESLQGYRCVVCKYERRSVLPIPPTVNAGAGVRLHAFATIIPGTNVRAMH